MQDISKVHKYLVYETMIRSSRLFIIYFNLGSSICRWLFIY